MTSNAARDALYARLRSVLGESDAATMMQLLPPGGPQEIATRADIARLDVRMGRLEERMDRLEGTMGRLEERMGRLEERMDRLEGTMNKLEGTMGKFDDRLHDFHGALREQTRNFVLASTASVVTVGGLAFAAAALI